MIKLKLIVAHGKCLNCGTERILYFASNAAYGEKIDTIPNTKCPDCIEGKLVEDDKFGEQSKEIEEIEVTHHSWEMLGDNERKEKINRELIRQGYLK